ncbi:hypothetical protein MBLNU230_g1955t1 [Neophaeotheca triangularis]
MTPTPASLTNLKGKNILITGGSSGIGLATALLVSSLSPTNHTYILDRNPPPGDLDLGALNLTYHHCDITSWASHRAAFAAARAHFSTNRIDAVFVNAGIAETGDQFFNRDLDSSGQLAEPDRRTLRLDVEAACDSVKLAIWHMRDNEAVRGCRGRIVMTASLAGYLASAGAPHYSAAKHAVVGLMRALKREVAALQVAISVVAPGITDTPILTQERGPGKTGAQYAADMAARGIAVNKAESVALAVCFLMDIGMEGNGMGLLVQGGRIADLEVGIARGREGWMGKEMLELFRGGRDKDVFELRAKDAKL